MKYIRPSVAFALGLWIGALVAGVVGWIWVETWQPPPPPRTETVTVTDLEEQLGKLRSDNNRLAVENERLRETIELYQEEVAEEPAGPVPASPTAIPPTQPGADEQVTLAQLEARAVQNDVEATRALGEVSTQDHGETLVRVWESGKLDLPCLRTAAWYLGNLVEANPKISAALRALFEDGEADPELWLSALDGLTTRSPATTDYRARTQLLVELEEVAVPTVVSQIDSARKRLLREWAEAEGDGHRSVGPGQ